MKKLLLIFLFIPSTVFAQYYENERRSLAWDYSYLYPAITRFEVRVDSSNWEMLPASTRQWLMPILSAGSHTASVRACNTECSDAAIIVFNVLSLLPHTPTNYRLLIPPSKTLTTRQSSDVIYSYGYMWRLQKVSSEEMKIILSNYPGPRPIVYGPFLVYLENWFLTH